MVSFIHRGFRYYSGERNIIVCRACNRENNNNYYYGIYVAKFVIMKIGNYTLIYICTVRM